MRSLAAVLLLLLYFVFALYERKNEIRIKGKCQAAAVSKAFGTPDSVTPVIEAIRIVQKW